MAAPKHRDYYRAQLEAGQRYQDFVADRLYREGIVVIGFQSREYQYKSGENLLGLEIKFDDKLASTGNFWIEIAEKTNPANPAWIASGIHRNDRAWLYGIGNYDEFWIFAVATLKRFHAQKAPRILENNLKTSQGFLLDRGMAMVICARQFDWKSEPPLVFAQHNGAEAAELPADPPKSVEHDDARPAGDISPDVDEFTW